jgi:predicted metal-dependent phosphoesterase TrpH
MLYDIHTHTTCSDGVNSVEEVVAHARKLGLAGIAVTDHNTLDGALRAMKLAGPDLKVIPGFEVSAKEGHILVLGVTELIPKKIPAAEVVERAHELGGIAIAAHPYDVIRGGVGKLISSVDFDAVEVCNGRTLLEWRSSRKVAERAHLNMVGGSDAHSLQEMGTITINADGDVL